MKIKCRLGFHTGLINSRYQFKAYNNVTYEGGILIGHGSIDAFYHRTCGDCGKEMKEQAFAMLWFPKGTYGEDSAHSLEECIAKANAFQSNKG